MSAESKRCGRCRKIKPISEFNRRTDRGTAQSYCKPCNHAASITSRAIRRYSLAIRDMIIAALNEHGPLSTADLLCLVRCSIRDDSVQISTLSIAQHARRIDAVTSTPVPRRGSVWRIAGDQRPQTTLPPQEYRRSHRPSLKIGMDPEHLAWMAEQQARAAKRTQRGNIQDFAAAVLNQRGSQA